MEESAKENENKNKEFHNFVLREYDNIASAHFNSNQNITNFFRSFLIIISLPVTAFTALFNIDIIQDSLINKPDSIKTPILIIGIFFLIISFVGYSIYWYVLNLHFDGILYARTINGIRKLYFDQNETDQHIRNRYRVLPQSKYLPSYRDFQFFGPIILAFCLINIVYLFLSINLVWFYLGKLKISDGVIVHNNGYALRLIGYLILFFAFHIGIYLILSSNREQKYLRSNILGVDIDGVINKHREQFCQILKKNTKKILLPEEIVVIPVRDIPDCELTEEDEIAVFNDPDYWIKMPEHENVGKILKKISNSLSMRIFIFTLRPWPNTNFDENTNRKWSEKSNQYAKQELGKNLTRIFTYLNYRIFKNIPFKIILLKFFLIFRNLFRRYDYQSIERITRSWLKEHDVFYDHLYIEKMSENVSDPSANILNRFYISQNLRIRFFVEDDIEKAIKLSFICDYVFLMDQPYNKSNELPGNIIRVNNWDELYREIKRLW